MVSAHDVTRQLKTALVEVYADFNSLRAELFARTDALREELRVFQARDPQIHDELQCVMEGCKCATPATDQVVMEDVQVNVGSRLDDVELAVDKVRALCRNILRSNGTEGKDEFVKSIQHDVDGRHPPWGAAMWKAHFIERSGKDETNSLLAKTVADLWLKVDYLLEDQRRAPGEEHRGSVPESQSQAHFQDLFVELCEVESSVTSTLSAHKVVHHELSQEIQQLSHVTQGQICKVAVDIKSVAAGDIRDERDLESFAMSQDMSKNDICVRQRMQVMENVVSLEGSTWDAILLLGMRLGFSRFSDLGVALACVACVATQLVLCSIFITLNEEQLETWSTELEQVTAWAATESPTLVERLCVSDISLGTHYRQNLVVQVYFSYHKGITECLAMLAQVMWAIGVLNVVCRIEDVRSAIWSLGRTRRSEVELRLHRVTFVGFSRGRLCFATCVLGLRLSVLLFLATLGADILASTFDAWDLMLKVVLLHFVLHFDREAFQALIPAQYRTVLKQTNPMHVKTRKGLHQVILRIILVSCVVAVFFSWYHPRLNYLMTSVEEMCSVPST
mmetsp:Transcript_53980/g.144406  ORF Transcript_53980/g.144406 Transcript_53980/m.144406 type:complete len:563 (-) Transcript_53980:663-2351(-)